MEISIAYFISPHGFGHAARAAAIMAALQRINKKIKFHVFTHIPKWFFDDSLIKNLFLYDCAADVGMFQKTPFQHDLTLTIAKLGKTFPYNPADLEKFAHKINQLSCQLIVCDIAPIGIEVAHIAGLPSILVENFTWDWIYEEYLLQEPKFQYYISYLKIIFNRTHFLIQAEPVCVLKKNAFLTHPISRLPRTPPQQIRTQLEVPLDNKLILITNGGISDQYAWSDSLLEKLYSYGHINFIVPGGSSKKIIKNNILLLPHSSNYFHPDIVNACDAVIGKAGYSTVAEVFHAGVPFGYIARSNFKESAQLCSFIAKHLPGVSISENKFKNGHWIEYIPVLLDQSRNPTPQVNGADQVAQYIIEIIMNLK